MDKMVHSLDVEVTEQDPLPKDRSNTRKKSRGGQLNSGLEGTVLCNESIQNISVQICRNNKCLNLSWIENLELQCTEAKGMRHKLQNWQGGE